MVQELVVMVALEEEDPLMELTTCSLVELEDTLVELVLVCLQPNQLVVVVVLIFLHQQLT